ncbi:hypothetical protein VNO78_02565 [Psophocarpus tetragonolobus]|uniref:Nuclear pore complex protein NUP1 n=1 Tax=Psophocarpus tetragonolobus TaxID=3891 RepID=A0AAN9XW39_PSOTE
MAKTDQITGTTPYEARGAGGKLRKPPPRKPPPSPYARPPNSTRRGWISKFVDPAYRLIAGGASRILPSFLSAAPLTSPLPCPTSAAQDQDNRQTGESHEDDSCKSDILLLASKSSELASTVDISGKLKSSSDLVLSRQDEKVEKSDKNKLSDIEQLVKGKKFSRDEFDRLVAVLNSRVMDLSNAEQGKENTILTSRKDPEGLAMAHGLPKVANEQRHEELAATVQGTSTSLGLSKAGAEIGSSPIEIARAYMDSRALEAGPSSKSIIHTVESTVHGDEAAVLPYDPSPSRKSSTCWPGAVVHDANRTPQSHRSTYGLHNFPRTPYSRTFLTKSKSKLIHMQGDNSHISSTPVLQSQTNMYLQDKSKAGASESGYGSVGPIRRTRHKVGAQYSSRKPAYSSLNGNSQREGSCVIGGFTPVTKSMEPVGSSCTHKSLVFEASVPTVHMHSTLMAKKILDHIDRTIPTPKEKSAELKMATKWKNPESSIDFSTISSNEDNGLLKLKDISPPKYDGLEDKKSTLWNEGKGNYHVDMQPKESTDKSTDVRKGPLASDVNFNSSIPRRGDNDVSTTHNFGGSQIFSMKSAKEVVTSKTLSIAGHPSVVNQEKKSLTNPATIKAVLPPISIKKPESKWTLASDNGSGFTFPVSASSSVFSEPPTPSIVPLFSSVDNQSKEGSTDLSYSFSLKKSSSQVVFSFPSTSNTAILNEAEDIKFKFGSIEKPKPRILFSFGNNCVH